MEHKIYRFSEENLTVEFGCQSEFTDVSGSAAATIAVDTPSRFNVFELNEYEMTTLIEHLTEIRDYVKIVNTTDYDKV